jgi:hypothetical protein
MSTKSGQPQVRSDDVAHALAGMSEERWITFAGQFSWCDRSRPVKVAEVEATTTASRKRTYRIELESREGERDPLIEMSINNDSPEELTAIALRVSLLGEKNPLAANRMDFMTDIPDPFVVLRGNRIADDVLRPLARLLLTETLVGSGRAARVTRFRLGTAIAGERRVELEWETPRRYSNAKVERRAISGVVALP